MGKVREKKDNVGLYILKHKDLDVALVHVDVRSGAIEYVLDIFAPEELPVGCREDGRDVMEWWKLRAIPDSRNGIQQVLRRMNEDSNLSLMLAGFGLSLTDHYWLQPIEEEAYWKDYNYYENDFSDELGNLLTDSGRIDGDEYVSRFSPSSSVNGKMKKKWVIQDGIRYLLKVNRSHFGQQSVNEVIASRLHEALGWENYVPYHMDKIVIEGKESPCSLNPLFTSQELEFVSAYQLVRNYKIPKDMSEYEAVIRQSVLYGMEEETVRRQLEYTILTDFILSNTDRHYNNFGFLYDSRQHKLMKMAPIFDTGNALFYDREIIPSKSALLNVNVTSFCKRESGMLRYITDPSWFPISRVADFSETVKQMLMEYTEMPADRAEQIAGTVEQKLDYLKQFLSGTKIWKKEKYW